MHITSHPVQIHRKVDFRCQSSFSDALAMSKTFVGRVNDTRKHHVDFDTILSIKGKHIDFTQLTKPIWIQGTQFFGPINLQSFVSSKRFSHWKKTGFRHSLVLCNSSSLFYFFVRTWKFRKFGTSTDFYRNIIQLEQPAKHPANHLHNLFFYRKRLNGIHSNFFSILLRHISAIRFRNDVLLY